MTRKVDKVKLSSFSIGTCQPKQSYTQSRLSNVTKKTFTLRDFDLFDFKAGWPLGWPLDLKGLEVLVVEYKVPAAPDPAIYHVGFKRKADQSSGTYIVCT